MLGNFGYQWHSQLYLLLLSYILEVKIKKLLKNFKFSKILFSDFSIEDVVAVMIDIYHLGK
jgi:hypothetical protein